jgi:hypothetical protein
MGSERITGKQSPGLEEILAAPGGPSYRNIEYWVDKGYLRPNPMPGERVMWSWPPAEQRVAIAMGRLVTAGLRPDAAERVARHPNWGPVVLAPGVIISLFPIDADAASEVA